ncbi:dihydroorotate dehydrogenase [candidate division KSB1 bacterium]|nr:MAG: dihydroorotate dehydrogenase [candidate division KSB1 bacterium]
MKNLKSRYSANVEIKNPVVIASCGLTETAEKLKKIEDSGAGSSVMKTLFEDEKCRKDPAPKYKIIQRGSGKLTSYSFYSYEQASKFGPWEYAEEISKAKKSVDFPVIGSIACITEKGWEEYSKLLEEAGADAIELNLSCPYSDHIRDYRNKMNEYIKDVLKIVKNSVKIDIVCKMTPQLNSPLLTAKIIEENGADGITSFSRFAGLDIDILNEKPVMHGGYAGYGGSYSLLYALRWISEFSPYIKIPVSGSGGIHNGQDIIKLIMAGADSTQICTLLYLSGFGIIRKLIDEIEKFMDEKGYSSIKDFKSKICNKILSLHQVDRTQKVKADIDSNLCNSCGICEKICNFNAISKTDNEAYYIIENVCSGCGLCVEMCPKKAIYLYQI